MKEQKKGKVLLICLVTVVLFVAIVVGCVLLITGNSDKRDDEKNVYFALSSLKDRDTEMASNYLGQVSDDPGRTLGFSRDSAEVIRQKLIGNQALCTIQLDVIHRNYSLDSTQSTIVAYLETESAESDSYDAVSYDAVIDQIIRQMEITESRRARYDEQYKIERDAMRYGRLSEENAKTYESLCGKEPRIRLELGAALSNDNYSKAFETAVDLVADDPTEENFLTLADVISRSVHADVPVDENYLYKAIGKASSFERTEEETAEAEKEIGQVQGDILELEMKAAIETDQVAAAALNTELEELHEKLQTLEIKRDNPFLYRAINSVRMIPSVEGRVVLAKLYYAAGLKEEAEKCLQDAAGSFRLRYCDNTDVVQGLHLLDDLYNGDGAGASDSHSSEIVSRMLDGVLDNPFLLQKASGSSLGSDMSGDLLAQYKYRDNDIYITNVDDSAYPQITVSVNGRKEIIDDLVNKKDMVVRDTHYDVDYDVTLDTTSLSSICFVVDISGSMEGEPIQNARTALRKFVESMNGNTEVSIVAFDDSAYERTPLTQNGSDLLAGIETLQAVGGTNIATGISGGIDSLRNAVGAKNIILMTDGQSNEDYSWQARALSDGVTIFTVGFGSVNTAYLTRIAESTGGTFTLADSSGDLQNVYASIGSVIGNRAKITYTVTENVEELPRYVHIRAERYEASQTYQYRATSGSSHTDTTADNFTVFRGLRLSLRDMTRYAENNEKFRIEFSTSADEEIESIVVDGEEYQPLEEYWDLAFEILPLDEGLFDVTFRFRDGSSRTVEDLIFVVDDSSGSATKLFWNETVRIGSVLLRSDRLYLLPDGTVVMENVSIHESGDTTGNWSLDAQTYNFIVFDSVTPSETEVDGYLDWGDNATFHLDGRVLLRSGDKQNTYGNETISSCGKLIGTIDPDQCTFAASDD